MTLPVMPSTHRWVELGPGLSKAGRNALFAKDGEQVWVWDDETGTAITDLLDDQANPTTLTVKDGWAGTGDPSGVGVPASVHVASFSIGRDGRRIRTLPLQLFLDAAANITAQAVTAATDRTLAVDDAGKVVEVTKATAATITIPPQSSVSWAAGTIVEVFQYGTGQVTIAAGSGVSLLAPLGTKTAMQYGSIYLRRRAEDEWVVAGDTTT